MCPEYLSHEDESVTSVAGLMTRILMELQEGVVKKEEREIEI
jgi:hypothetical protein